MAVESNYAIAIATLSDWLIRLAPVFEPLWSKTKTNPTMYAWFSRALSELQVIARNCDWFIALFVPAVIGRSNCLGFGFSTVISKPFYSVNRNLLAGWERYPSFEKLRPVTQVCLPTSPQWRQVWFRDLYFSVNQSLEQSGTPIWVNSIPASFRIYFAAPSISLTA